MFFLCVSLCFVVCELQACPWMNMSATIMMVLEGCSATKHHLFLINTLMHLKRDVCLVSWKGWESL